MSEQLSPAQEALERIIELATKEYEASDEFGYASAQHCAATEVTQDRIWNQFRSDHPTELLLHMAVLEIASWRRHDDR